MPHAPGNARPMQTDLDLRNATIGGRGIHRIKNDSDPLDYPYLDGKNHRRMLINRNPTEEQATQRNGRQ